MKVMHSIVTPTIPKLSPSGEASPSIVPPNWLCRLADRFLSILVSFVVGFVLRRIVLEADSGNRYQRRLTRILDSAVVILAVVLALGLWLCWSRPWHACSPAEPGDAF